MILEICACTSWYWLCCLMFAIVFWVPTLYGVQVMIWMHFFWSLRMKHEGVWIQCNLRIYNKPNAIRPIWHCCLKLQTPFSQERTNVHPKMVKVLYTLMDETKDIICRPSLVWALSSAVVNQSNTALRKITKALRLDWGWKVYLPLRQASIYPTLQFISPPRSCDP